MGIVSIFPFGIPLANVLILLSSSLPVQTTLIFIKRGVKSSTLLNVAQTIGCTGLFLLLQLKEYTVAFFAISDSMYGTGFYSATGLHGLHVGFALILFLIV